jgi:hypothetical protein
VTEKKNVLIRVLERMIEGRRLAAKVRADAYISALGLDDPRSRR